MLNMKSSSLLSQEPKTKEQIYSQFQNPSPECGYTSILTWRGDFSEKKITRHAASLATAQRDEHKVWVVFDYISTAQPEMQEFAQPQYTLVFTAISIPASQKARSVRAFLSAQLPLDAVASSYYRSIPL